MKDLVKDYDLNNFLPKQIYNMPVMKNIFNSQEFQMDILTGNLRDIRNNMFIRTATWGLRYWEEGFLIPVYENDTYENRRSRIWAHMRGYGICSKKMIKRVALSFSCGDVDVEEHSEDFYIVIVFKSIMGIPPKMEDFKKIMRVIVPAHLGIEYKFLYNTEEDIEKAGWTEEELEQFTEEEIMTSTLIKTHTFKSERQGIE